MINTLYIPELLGRRDPYYDRRGDPYPDQREYGRDREREMFRDRPPLDYDRDRPERERFSRDERFDEKLCTLRLFGSS